MVFFGIFLLTSCSINNKVKDNNKIYKISLVTLITNPEKYNKKRIQVEGYYYYEHEASAIYINKSDFENALFKNAVYLYMTTDFLKSQGIEKPYKGYISIEGIFNKDKLGSGGFFSGIIEDVISISRLYKRGSENVFNID